MGELLDQAIGLFRRNFLPLIGTIALMQIPVMVILVGVQYDQFDPFGPESLFPYSPIILIDDPNPIAVVSRVARYALIHGFAAAAVTKALADGFLGFEIRILETYKAVFKLWRPLLGTLILYAVFLIPLSILLVEFPLIGAFTGLGPLVFLILMWGPLIIPVIVLENRPLGKTIKRAWSLGMERFWWLLGYALVLTLFSFIVVLGPVNFIRIVVVGLFSVPEFGHNVFWISVLSALLSILSELLYFPLRSAGYLLVYFDLRVRFEGFDLALLTRQPGVDIHHSDDIAALGISRGEKFKFGRYQLGYLLGLSLTIIGFLVGLNILMEILFDLLYAY